MQHDRVQTLFNLAIRVTFCFGRRSLGLVGLSVAALLVAPWSATDLLNGLVPSNGYTLYRDLAYGEGPRRTLDFYMPRRTLVPPPLVVFFYGGGWEAGKKEEYRFVAQAFASRGYAIAIPDYRLYPEVRYPTFLEDAAAAVAWARRTAPTYGAATGPVILVGHSAGAYIATMLTLDEAWLAKAGAPVCEAVRATVGLAGPYDFLPLSSAKLIAIFGAEEERPRTQPINHVQGTEPSLLLLTGTADRRVQPGNTARLAVHVHAMGGKVRVKTYQGHGHAALVAALAAPLRWLAPVLDDVDDFLRTVDSSCRETGATIPGTPR